MNKITYSRLYDEKKLPSQVVKSLGESLTVPKQSLSVKELVARFSRGQSIGVRKQMYFDPDGHDEIDATLDGNFDLSDVSRLQDELIENQLIRAEEQKKRNILNEKNERKGVTTDEEASDKEP